MPLRSCSKTNYGARLDYILITPDLLPWVKDSDIQPQVVGSDHCPVYLDFYDEIDDPIRGRLKLWDLLNPGRQPSDMPPPPPPPFAARFFSEFSGKQKTLQGFFVKKSDLPSTASKPSPSPSPAPAASTAANGSVSVSPAPAPARRESSSQDVAKVSKSTNGSKKGKERSSTPPEVKKTGQQDLSSFFKPPADRPKKKRKKSKTGTPPPASTTSSSRSSSRPKPSPSPASTSRDGQEREVLILDDDDDDDAVPDAEARANAIEAPYNPNAESATAWANIFATKPPPLCDGHNEPARMFVTNKHNVNKGRRFFLCAR